MLSSSARSGKRRHTNGLTGWTGLEAGVFSVPFDGLDVDMLRYVALVFPGLFSRRYWVAVRLELSYPNLTWAGWPGGRNFEMQRLGRGRFRS